MPNWCDFGAVVRGDKKEIDVFYKRLNDARKHGDDTHQWHLYCLFEEHGYKRDFILSNQCPYIGGSIDQVDEPVFNGTDWHVYIYMTTRWSPMIEGFELLLRNYISLKGVYYAEEPGCEIYVNTDSDRKFFTVKYCIYDDDDGSEYFDDDDEFLDFMKSVYHKEISSISDLKDDDDIKIKRGKSIRFHRFVSN